MRWVDQYEDGQGRGKMTAACSPAYDFAMAPPTLLGVHCLGINVPVRVACVERQGYD